MADGLWQATLQEYRKLHGENDPESPPKDSKPEPAADACQRLAKVAPALEEALVAAHFPKRFEEVLPAERMKWVVREVVQIACKAISADAQAPAPPQFELGIPAAPPLRPNQQEVLPSHSSGSVAVSALEIPADGKGRRSGSRGRGRRSRSRSSEADNK